jgi:folate-dependent phosphoribosylglycinamide formyltransferase PurN
MTARPTQNKKFKTVLICHEEMKIDREGLSRWLASFSDLAGVVVLKEKKDRKFKRVKREIERVGFLRFFDVMAFRLYYKFFLAKSDGSWEQEKIKEIAARCAFIDDVPTLETHSPNSIEAENFIRETRADVVIARCKVILKKRIFSLPRVGTFVMHPGICPEYRNAHGCFWALARGDVRNVGMTLLKVDEGVDTGPIYGYYSYDFDSLEESHIKIQTRVVTENLDEIAAKLNEIVYGGASPIEVHGRESGVWGHPWLSKYLSWKLRARREGK